ncbi:MAG TPA: RDD family protein [Deltaproteobacteria bacterium]|nr:MAG: hypothetical protein DRG83_09785 [Deltaproteobacteria bacterium]HDM76019.1 RDD family protein [Deltaproteobacteria bacterium]
MQYFFHINGRNVGPLKEDEIRQLVSSGRVKKDTLAWKPGMKQWAKVKDVPELLVTFPELEGAPKPSSTPITMPRVEPQPESYLRYQQIPVKENQWGVTGNYAGFWKRFAAAFLDGIITGIAGGLIGFALGFVLVALGTRDPDLMRGIGNIVGAILGWLYFALMESSQTQGTLGKMALGIKVTDLNGHRIGFGKATGRYFGKIISAMILFIGFLMIGFTKKKQGLHDMMAGCLVVNK